MAAEGIILAKSLISNLLRACAIVQWANNESDYCYDKDSLEDGLFARIHTLEKGDPRNDSDYDSKLLL